MLSTHKPSKTYEHISKVENDGLDKEDFMTYLNCLLEDPRQKITESQELGAYNAFTESGLQLIIKKYFNINKSIPNNRNTTAMDKQIKSYSIQITFTSVELDTPTYVNGAGLRIPKTPDDCRVSNEFYAADLKLNVYIKLVAYKHNGEEIVKDTTVSDLSISSVPIMVKSKHCTTYNMPSNMLEKINEDAFAPGGYFINNGKEWAILASENIVYNKPLIFKSTLKPERVYCTVISQQDNNMFGNSMNLVIRISVDYAILLEIQTITFNKVKIPFYTLYKLFGVESEQDILEMIVYDTDKKSMETEKMTEIVIQAFQAKYTTERKSNIVSFTDEIVHFFDLAKQLEDPSLYKKDPETLRHVITSTVEKLDKSFLPHIGITADSRRSKLLHLSMMIRSSIGVDIGTLQGDDRDHYANKRIHGAGVSISKAFKTLFNFKVTTPILNILQNEVNNKSFDTISMTDTLVTIKNITSGKELESAFIKYIMASDSETSRTKEKSRIISQSLERKNIINVILTLRTIVANISKVAKSTKRSDNIRYYHPTSPGYICPFNTPEGEKVGTVKQLAITAIITDESNIEDMKYFVMKDPSIISIDDISPKALYTQYLTRVYVDGDWIVCTKDPEEFVSRYKKLRREGVVQRFTSIEWNTINNVIYIYTDVGRLMRPLLIVDNNLDEFNKAQEEIYEGKRKKEDAVKFVQNIRLTKKHIHDMRSGKMKFEDLIKMGFVQYIYPGEEVLVCPSFEQLKKEKNDYLKRWDYCDIPQTLFGIAVLTGPYFDRNQPFRNVLVHIHAKQGCGQSITNFQTATRRSHRFYQHYVDTPIVKTITRDFVAPNSQNLQVLYGVYLGYNQEDSSIVNKASVERGCLKGDYCKMETIEIEKNQTIKIPQAKETHYMRSTSYNKLKENGIVGVGVVLNKGDIMIGRVVELAQPTDKGLRFIDKSVPYDQDEPGRVVSVITKLEGETKFVMLTFEYEMPLSNGDKLSSRAGNKNIISLSIPEMDMPYTKEGLRPDLILNPHSLPTRMTLAQMFETTVSKLAVKQGHIVDGTVYTRFDTEELVAELEKEGLAVRDQMINGITGELIDVAMFFGPQTVLRLPKFVREDRHAIGKSGPKNPITGQALTGKRSGGGHKVGEMELWVLLAQGAANILNEEFFLDSDTFPIHVCRNCHKLAVYNERRNKYKCTSANCESSDIAVMDSSKTALLFLQELQMANIGVGIQPEARMFEQNM